MLAKSVVSAIPAIAYVLSMAFFIIGLRVSNLQKSAERHIRETLIYPEGICYFLAVGSFFLALYLFLILYYKGEI